MSANEIIPNLFLGDITSSQNREFIEGYNIGMVVNCSKTIPFLKNGKFIKVRVPVDDNLQETEIKSLAVMAPKVIRKIWDEYSKGTTILIHCHAGVQRSAAVTAMFLIFLKRYTHKEAMENIQKRRPVAFQPSPNFYKAIVAFEASINEAIRRVMDRQSD